MTGSYLFNYESYYNGLMTDWGLLPMMGSFPKNDVLFSSKRRVVFIKMTCCFYQNDVLFSVHVLM